MHEEWKDVVGWEGIYRVSNTGRIKRIRGGKGAVVGRILKVNHVSKNRRKYPTVLLQDKGRSKRAYVHLLVAEAFMGPRPAGMQINHIDANKDNNDVRNLEWSTPSNNIQHALRNGLIPVGSQHIGAKLTEDSVREMRKRQAQRESFNSLAREFGVDATVVRRICRRLSWRHVS